MQPMKFNNQGVSKETRFLEVMQRSRLEYHTGCLHEQNFHVRKSYNRLSHVTAKLKCLDVLPCS